MNTDNCPNCTHRDIAPTAEHDDGKQIVSRYRCPHCGHRWSCSRLADAYPPRYRAWDQPAA